MSELTDKELRALLFEHGQTPGPITGTTRRVYELQLKTLLTEGSASAKAAEKKKKRRQTLDTLRTTEKPKIEPRRSEKFIPKIPASLNISDYSDTELQELSLSPELETPEPPQSLVFSNSPRPTRRRSTRDRDREGRDLSLFSDTEEEKKPAAKKKLPAKKKTVSVWQTSLTVLLGVVVVLVGVGVSVYMLDRNLADSSYAPPCLNLTFENNMTLAECDRLFWNFAKQKVELDKFSGEVMCEKKEGDLHQAAPEDPLERHLLFTLRDSFNYSIFIQKDDVFLELESEAELSSFDPEKEQFFYSTNTPHISWFCYVSRILSNFAFYILTSVAILVMAQIAHKVYQWKRAKEKQETGQMFELIDQIIEELQRNYSKYQTDPVNYVPYVAIPHARDRLLLPSERTAMKHIWERAVQFIAQHESRVRVEMRRVQSEDFPVWYWLEASKSPPVQPDSTSPDFLYPDLDAELPLDKGKAPAVS